LRKVNRVGGAGSNRGLLADLVTSGVPKLQPLKNDLLTIEDRLLDVDFSKNPLFGLNRRSIGLSGFLASAIFATKRLPINATATTTLFFARRFIRIPQSRVLLCSIIFVSLN
jgi:hypothetical protein